MIEFIIVASVYLVLLAAKVVLAWLYVSRYPAPAPRGDFSDVTILQPVLGGDPRLAGALATNLAQLQGARFAWLLDEDDAAAWKICRSVAAKFPAARVELVPSPPVPSQNPKIFKLARAGRR
jgi:ceramide glucosyltransferase